MVGVFLNYMFTDSLVDIACWCNRSLKEGVFSNPYHGENVIFAFITAVIS